MTASRGLAFAKLFVTDLDRSAEFYRAGLGLEPAQRFATPEFDELVLRARDGGGSLVLCRWKDGRALDRGNAHGPVGFVVADVDSTYAACCAAGAAALFPPSAYGPARVAIFRDPDGHSVEILNPGGAAPQTK
ncbi:VOC family protein [Sphingomonas sp. ST-64]|uniref:VOC family protein n=1 Tax=Sphingomonas plantiphila TaxID=3163295 RepID=A0ABW8YPQ8_9SPHN